MTILEWISFILATIGVAFTLISSIGVLRFPDLYTRVHAAGKAGTLGIMGILIGVAFYHGDPLTIIKMVALVAFFLLTAPVAAHMLDRAAYLTGVRTTSSTVIDELKGRYDPESRRLS